MSYDDNHPVGSYLNCLDQFETAMAVVTSGLQQVSGQLPVDALRTLNGEANTIYQEADSATKALGNAKGAMDAADVTMENTTLIINPAHSDYMEAISSAIYAIMDLTGAREREVSCAQSAELGAAALAETGQQMTAQQAVIAAKLEHYGRMLEVASRMRGIIQPPT